LVYLPKGEWYDYWTGRQFAGEGWTNLPVTLENIPLFVRSGAFVFRSPLVQNTGELPGKRLEVLVMPGADSSAKYYEDDGATMDYRQGQFLKRNFHQTRSNEVIRIDLGAPEGTYRPAARDLVFEIRVDQEPKTVSVQDGDEAANAELPRVEVDALSGSPKGWAYAEGMVTVKMADNFAPLHLQILRGQP
jgi:alpha-glucosidase